MGQQIRQKLHLSTIQPLTYLKCPSCGTNHSRGFQDGDYIFKKAEDKCPNCGGQGMEIVGIYVPEKPQAQQTEVSKTSEKP